MRAPAALIHHGMGWLPCFPFGYNPLTGEPIADCGSISDQQLCPAGVVEYPGAGYCPSTEPGYAGLDVALRANIGLGFIFTGTDPLPGSCYDLFGGAIACPDTSGDGSSSTPPPPCAPSTFVGPLPVGQSYCSTPATPAPSSAQLACAQSGGISFDSTTGVCTPGKPATTTPTSNTWIYVAGGVAAMLLVAVLMRRR